jgi:membrane associated rhomboid family serine protease
MPARRFPIVNVAIIVANFAVWLFYELPHLNSAVFHVFYPCTVTHACSGPEPWGVSWITAMFLHGTAAASRSSPTSAASSSASSLRRS